MTAATLTLPPFPEDVPTLELPVIDYELIKSGDSAEIDRLWKTATELGFWTLKNHGVDAEVTEMFDMAEELMALPLEEKMKYEQGDTGKSFGYKAGGYNATDESGALDHVEFINVAKDDVLAWPKVAYREYPSVVNDHMESTIKPWTLKALEVNYTLLEAFNDRLGLPAGTLAKLHAMDMASGSETRCIRNPPNPTWKMGEHASLGAHTDIGSLTFLNHNRLGGLQVMLPGTEEWKYIKPIPGHAVCNIGDTLVIYSGGILRSNLHRIIPAPGEQAKFDRWSLLYITRPSDANVLSPLVEDSTLIANAVAKVPAGKYNPGTTAKEWHMRRIKLQRAANQEGPQTWRSSRGTEHNPSAW